jgi:hypothetical protein
MEYEYFVKYLDSDNILEFSNIISDYGKQGFKLHSYFNVMFPPKLAGQQPRTGINIIFEKVKAN